MSIAVVILNWNGEKLLESFLPSVLQYSGNATIYVADNASSDRSVAMLAEKFPSVKVILNKRNEGYAGGYNLALREVSEELAVLLNSDVEVTQDWLQPMKQFMTTHPGTAACQPKIRAWNERERFEYAGAAGGYLDALGYPFCAGRIFDTLEKDQGQFDDQREIFWATGACLMLRTKVFADVGGFDSTFFAHMEEIDLCWRIRIAGHKIFYVPGSHVFHVGGGTLNKYSSRKTFLNMRNNLVMLVKNLPEEKIWTVLATRLVLDGIAAFRFLATGGFKHMFAVVRAHFSLYKRLRKLLAERPAELHRYPGSVYKKSIVLEYFAFGRKTFNQLNDKDFTPH